MSEKDVINRLVKLGALLHGGGHEGCKRSGTLNVPGIVSMGKAAEICLQQMKADTQRIRALRDELEKALLQIPDTSVNGNIAHRLYDTTNIQFKGCDSDALIWVCKTLPSPMVLPVLPHPSTLRTY